MTPTTLKWITIRLTGPMGLFYLDQLTIEGIPVHKKATVKGNELTLELHEIPVSEDSVLDIFLEIWAPNRVEYLLDVKASVLPQNEPLVYNQKLVVRKNGTLQALVQIHIPQTA